MKDCCFVISINLTVPLTISNIGHKHETIANLIPSYSLESLSISMLIIISLAQIKIPSSSALNLVVSFESNLQNLGKNMFILQCIYLVQYSHP